VGIYKSTGRYGHLAGDGRSCPAFVRLLTPPPAEVLPGMMVVAEPVSYPIANSEATARIAQVLGWPEDEGVQITSIMHKFGLADTFPPEVLEESERIPDTISEHELKQRDDWRQRCVITIDPETARDYDDAIAVTRHGSNWELAVHIADVSHYVRPGSALDMEAQSRGNSTYLPDRVLPMLPPRLCDDLCSLKSGCDRPTRLCLLRLSPAGEVKHAHFADAVIGCFGSTGTFEIDRCPFFGIQGLFEGDARFAIEQRASGCSDEFILCSVIGQCQLEIAFAADIGRENKVFIFLAVGNDIIAHQEEDTFFLQVDHLERKFTFADFPFAADVVIFYAFGYFLCCGINLRAVQDTFVIHLCIFKTFLQEKFCRCFGCECGGHCGGKCADQHFDFHSSLPFVFYFNFC
jgi:hypothetical protein